MDRTTPRTHRATELLIGVAFLLGLLPAPAPAAPSAEVNWPDAFAAMPLPSPAPRLNRDNAICVILEAFRSNALVKAIVVLPGVSDDFYLVNRDQPPLNLAATNLWQAVHALTNSTAVRATLRPPFLLLHLPNEHTQPAVIAGEDTLARKLKNPARLHRLACCDAHWETLQPELQKRLRTRLRPEARSEAAWHFERHNVSGWGLTGWELLLATAWAGGTEAVIADSHVSFQRARVR